MSTSIPLFDHVAVRVASRDAHARDAVEMLDWVVIERTERLTLLGVEDVAGKLTLLDEASVVQQYTPRVVGISCAGPAPGTADATQSLHVAGMRVTYGEDGAGLCDGSIVGVTIAVEHVDDAVHALSVLPHTASSSHSGRVAIGYQWVQFVAASEHLDGGAVLDHLGVRIDRIDHVEAWSEQANVAVERVSAARSSALFMHLIGSSRMEYIDVHAPARMAGRS